jgi:Ser/Thr protein kinase RdoA (MazF antagonist)
VPKLFPVESDSVLVMERLRGSTLNVYEQNAEPEPLEQIFHQLGQAIARIVAAAPGSRTGGRRDMSSKPGFDYQFYCQASLETAFDTVIGRAAKALVEQDIPDRTVLEESLGAITDHRDSILAYPGFVQMDDFHTCNIMADGPELTGFVDLEMSRYGNKVLVLAAALNASGKRQPMWRALRRGFEEECREALDSVLLSLVRICAPFSTWIRFMWYWSTDDLPHWAVGENMREAAIRDIKAAVKTAESIGL